MRLLIVTNNLYPYTNANSAIIYRVADILRDCYGVEIAFLGVQTAPLEDSSSGQKYQTWYMPATYQYLKKVPEGLTKRDKLLRWLIHPSCLVHRYHLATARYPLQHEYQKYLKKILREEHFDAILCVSCPYDTLYSAANVVRDIPLLAYKLDPWSTHYLHRNDDRYRRDEQWADRHCSAIFITNEMKLEYQRGDYQPPIDNIHAVEFPNLIPLPAIPASFSPQFDSTKLNCAYIGQLYTESLRGPAFLFDLFRRLADQNIVLHVIGNSESQARAYQEKLPPNVVLHGRVSPVEAKAYMMTADILVNMGNTVSNQLPSKTIDYLSCGKPILNICKIPDCPTLPYMAKYPLSHTIMEADGITEGVIQTVSDFCRENAHHTLPFEDVKKIFPTCTPEYVSSVVYRVLSEVVEKPTPQA